MRSGQRVPRYVGSGMVNLAGPYLASMCGDWSTVSAMGKQDLPERASELLCLPCLIAGSVRPAWTVSEGRAACIRHAVEDSNLDDMDQHNLYVVIYEALRARGYSNPY